MHFTKQKVLKFKPLPKINLETAPEPLMWYVLVQPLVPMSTTESGFHISEADNEDYKKAHCLGKVVKMGPLCFKTDVFKDTAPFQVGDIVFFGRHNGMWMNWDDAEFVLLADDRVMMRVQEEHLINFDGFQGKYQIFED